MMPYRRLKAVLCAALLLALFFCSVPVLSQEAAAPSTEPAAAPSTEPAAAPPTEPAAAPSEPVAPPPLDSGHTAWMMVCSALVLMMTAPGLAMFYCGLVRKKNVLSVIMQCVFLMGLLTVVWGLWGYSLAFGGSHPYIGNADYLFMKGVGPVWNEASNAPFFEREGVIPRLIHMVYQGMFFIITPALICGAFAERMKFSAMALFCVLWGTIVYCPLCHWVWDGGILAYGAEASKGFGGGALDFAGGAVVHISSGISALVCALMLGKRVGYGKEPMPPHNLTYTAIGAAMLWVGWFGFNAGSALAATETAAIAFVTTHFSAAAGTLAWAGIEWLRNGKPTVLGACSGAVAGLVCITPACGFVTPMAGLILGAIAGIVCYFACSSLKHALGYDDSLDAFGVHGVGGTLGALLTGVFATRSVADPIVSGGKPLGLLEGGGLLTGQLIATGVTIALAVVATFVLLKIIDIAIGLRVTQDQEVRGLDVSLHGEEGYLFY